MLNVSGVWVEDWDIDYQIKDALISSLSAFFGGLGSAYKINDSNGEASG